MQFRNRPHQLTIRRFCPARPIIIALGLLVDNGVVIVEDIVSRIGRGVPPQEAGLASGEQYALPLLISSISTIAAFLPLLNESRRRIPFLRRAKCRLRQTLGIVLRDSRPTAKSVMSDSVSRGAAQDDPRELRGI